jgi:hypothetical protein
MTTDRGKSVAVASTAPMVLGALRVRWCVVVVVRHEPDLRFAFGRGAKRLEAFPNRVQNKRGAPEGGARNGFALGPTFEPWVGS